MENKKHNEALITNEETLVRRAWIESALEGVRSHIDAPLPPAEAGNLGRNADEEREARAESERPHLYMAWSSRERRSGT
jgi:hypothetical protein